MAEAEELQRSQKDLMLAGANYKSFDPELLAMRERAAGLCQQYNASDAASKDKREVIVRDLFGEIGEGFYITPPFQCDYGQFIKAGANFYTNFGCCILDCNLVSIGDNVKFGPQVQVYAASHPTDPQMRLDGWESAHPVKIGSNVWVGGAAIILPGVTIGDNVTVGAGSVVTKDVPDNVVVAGNPAKVIRRVQEAA